MAAKKSESVSKKSDDVVKEGDMIYLEYDAYIKEKDLLFETTKEELAREHDIFDEKSSYGPVAITVGKGNVFEGLEEALIGAKVGDEKEVEIPPEKAAGPWDKEKMEIFPIREFIRDKIDPYPGLEVTIKNKTGTVMSVGAGRVRVDFNNPLAGKILLYKFKVVSKITDLEEKIKASLKMDYGHEEEFGIEHKGTEISLTLPDICKYDQNWMIAKYRVISDLRDMGFTDIRFIEEYLSEKKEESVEASDDKTEEAAENTEEKKEPEEENAPDSENKKESGSSDKA